MANTVQVIGTAQVIVTEVAEQVIELAVPAAPATVQIATAGPQGTAGPSGIGSVLVDATTTANTIYVGIAAKDAAQSGAVWTITRSVFSAAGIRTSKGTAIGVTWTGRTTHTYA